jgi:hypothetical protein
MTYVRTKKQPKKALDIGLLFHAHSLDTSNGKWFGTGLVMLEDKIRSFAADIGGGRGRLESLRDTVDGIVPKCSVNAPMNLS